MAIDLKDKVCLVTGAARGIGRAVAQGFLRRGAQVVATDRDPVEWPGATLAMPWDVTHPDRAAEVVEQVVGRLGRLDVLVANAGIYPKVPWDQIDPVAWRQVMSVNVEGTWFAAQASAAAMRRGGYGKIITVSSVLTQVARGEEAHYETAKAAILGLTRSLSRALGRDGIRVNCVMPGAVRTDREVELYPDQSTAQQMLAQRQCLPHRLLPEGVEPAFAFLASAESDAITGQVICVDHGLIHW